MEGYSNKTILVLSALALVFIPLVSFAQSETPTWEIEYTWASGAENVIVEEGGEYSIDLNVRKSSLYEWPGTTGLGEIYKGELHNAQQVAGHFLNSASGVDFEIDSFPAYGKYFVVIREPNFTPEGLEWFEKGASTTNPAVQPPSLWGIINFELIDPNPPEPEPIIIIPGILGSWEKNGEWVIDPVFHTYDNLIETFELNGFVEDEDIFPFPYDWRESNVLTAGLLRNKINEVQAICSCDKVDIVAHSMGGLIARYYIQTGLYEDDVDQLIFLGTPHLGSPKTYLTWEGGETAPGLIDSMIGIRMNLEAKAFGFSDLFDYVQNAPISSMSELLPTTDYLRDGGSGTLRSYPTGYPRNTFLENLNSGITDLFNSGVQITNIVGNTGASTISGFRVVDSPSLPMWKHGYPENFDDAGTDRGLEFGEGDGTVTLQSASFIGADLLEFGTAHSNMPKDAQTVVFERLVGSLPDNISITPSPPDVLLFIKILSPADIQVVAPNGKIVGKDFDTGEEVNEIEGAFYSGFLTDDEYITIPDPIDGEYRVVAKGTESGGKYTVGVGYAGDEILLEAQTTSHILDGTFEEIVFDVDNANPENIGLEDITVITPEILIERTDQVFVLGWITDFDFKTDLIEKVQSVINSDGANFKSARKVLQKKLDSGSKDGFINEVGYNLLSEDIDNLSI